MRMIRPGEERIRMTCGVEKKMVVVEKGRLGLSNWKMRYPARSTRTMRRNQLQRPGGVNARPQNSCYSDPHMKERQKK